MSRTGWLKLLYLVALVAVGGTVAAVIFTVPDGVRLPAMVGLAIALLVPGRVQGHVFRDFFRGSRALRTARPADALPHFEAFRAQLEQAGWKRHLIWLQWTVYTPDALAMTWNNLGATHTALGDWDAARAAFALALERDDRYPLPHVNLARLAVVLDDLPTAERHLEHAARLGYRRTTVDELVHSLQAALVEVEGRGD